MMLDHANERAQIVVAAIVGELIARRGVLMSLDERRQSRFPSVLLQPLGHLSALESTVCEQPGSDYRKTVP